MMIIIIVNVKEGGSLVEEHLAIVLVRKKSKKKQKEVDVPTLVLLLLSADMASSR